MKRKGKKADEKYWSFMCSHHINAYDPKSWSLSFSETKTINGKYVLQLRRKNQIKEKIKGNSLLDCLINLKNHDVVLNNPEAHVKCAIHTRIAEILEYKDLLKKELLVKRSKMND